MSGVLSRKSEYHPRQNENVSEGKLYSEYLAEERLRHPPRTRVQILERMAKEIEKRKRDKCLYFYYL